MPSLPDSNGNLSAQPNSTGTDDLFGAKPSQPSSDPFGNDDNPFGAKPAATAKAPAAKGPDPINDIFAGINAASSKPVGKGTDSFGLFGDVNKNSNFKPQVNDPFGKPTSTLDPFSSSSNDSPNVRCSFRSTTAFTSFSSSSIAFSCTRIESKVSFNSESEPLE